MTDTIQKELARLRRYDEELTKVMNPDFKDWHQNSKEDWPELAAWVITNLREQLNFANETIDRLTPKPFPPPENTWSLVRYAYDGDHKVYETLYTGTQNECEKYGFDTFGDDIGMCLLDPQGREWE